MKKIIVYAFLSCFLSACTCNFYRISRSQNASQKIETPTSLSADSASINIQIPAK